MSDLLPTPPPEPEEQALAHAAGQSGSLLRLRDVQALNRSFRQLSEVQAALLQQMQELERQRGRQRAWLAPLLSLGGLVLGLALAALAFVWWRSGQAPPVIEVQAPPPAAITVQPTPITVQAPADPAVQEMMGLMRGQMESLRADQSADRAQLADLTERLLESERARLELLAQMAAPPAASPSAAAAAQAQETPAAAVLQLPGADEPVADPWLGVVNGLLAVDGYARLRFQQATRVPGAARLEQVVLMERGADGLVRAIVRAARADFLLQRMTGDLVLRLFDGFRTAEGARVALPADGLRIDLNGVTVDAWLDHFPELGATGVAAVPAAEAPAAGPPPSLRDIQRALDAFLARPGPFSYYRLNALGGVEGGALKLVQINWHDNGGRLVKTIEADTMFVRLHASRSSVELELHHGAFLDGEVKHPFAGDVFRMHLPQQDLAAWRASGIPFLETATE